MKTAIGKFLYRHFKDSILQVQFNEQSKKKGFEKMKKMFVDSNGKAYYRYIDDLEIPIMRKGQLEKVLKEIQMGISVDESNKIDEFILDEINKPKVDRAVIGHLILERKNREKLLIHPELLFEAVAIMYIREDEEPTLVDKEITRQKIEQLKKDSVGGLYDFFYSSGINTYLPFLEKSEEEWQEYWEQGIAQSRELLVKLQNFRNQEKSILGQE